MLVMFFNSPIQNSLPNSVVMADSLNSFKSCLDKFWSLHDFVYDYGNG